MKRANHPEMTMSQQEALANIAASLRAITEMIGESARLVQALADSMMPAPASRRGRRAA